MGNDGGSISKRDEMVRTKVTFEKIDPDLVRQSLWTQCSLSRATLSPPVVSCPLGKLYNKDAVISHLLSRHSSSSCSTSNAAKAVDPIPHIRALKNIIHLNLATNALYKPSTSGGQAFENKPGTSVYPFACPLSGKQMDGKQRFVYVASCGCAMSYTGLRTTVSTEHSSKDDRVDQRSCPVCGKRFNATGVLTKGNNFDIVAAMVAGSDVITINPTKQEEEVMRECMEKVRSEKATSNKHKNKRKKSNSKSSETTFDNQRDGQNKSENNNNKRTREESKAQTQEPKIAPVAAVAAFDV
ncbi:related to Protein C20orf43 [Melanopsichium pennsylvanicum]|uniref:Related to Protein C20orf43 n=1 Tax=Melanopsichium pennsylvanicum TaxID=63383 RepID=A0AAJ4XU27_9BASI|nr:related to Protein C20orf43 [Melanopsichium pennsylvanicum]